MEMRREKPEGFSLLEIIIAVGVIAIATLTIIALFTQVLRGSQKSVDLSRGTMLAQSIIAERIYSTFDDDLVKDFWWSQVDAGIYAGPGNFWERQTVNDMRYVLYAAPLTGLGAAPYRAAKIDVVVWWWDSEQQGGAREGYGQLRTEVTRLVNESATR